MRHNQNSRHMRGRRGNSSNHHNSGGGGNGNSNGGGNNQQRRVNPRVQTFDSNGPDVRIRGNAFQITEKYQTLARDAASAGDRILAESYHQHAEHYQRMINEMNDEYARQNPGQPHPQANGQPHQQQHLDPGAQPQPSVDGMSDLDQGFLVGPRGNVNGAPAAESSGSGEDSSANTQQRHAVRQRETETL